MISYFTSTGKSISDDVLISAFSNSDFKKYLSLSCQKSMALDPVLASEVQRIVFELIGSSYFGPYQIPFKSMKFIPLSILSPLTIIMSLSFLHGTFF